MIRKAGEMAFAMYAAHDYLAECGTPRRGDGFKGHQMVAYQSAVAHVAAYRWTNALPCPVTFRAADATSMLDAVAANMGIGVLPCFLGDPDDRLVRLDDLGGPQPETIWLVSRDDAKEVARVQIVSAWLLELFRAHANELNGFGGPP